MPKHVPFLKKEFIDQQATALLCEYEHARKITVQPPVPIEAIIEKHLKLSIDFADMHTRHGVPRRPDGETDILGAIYSDGSIFIDESLDPDENPSREGRYRFTLAHEGGGHWRLHRDLISQNDAQHSLFGEESAPSFLCRSSQKKATEEWQADYFASCLLMPRGLLADVWGEFFPDRKPRLLRQWKPVEHDLVETPWIHKPVFGLTSVASDDETLHRFCDPLAERFLVSPTAMRIRLEELGLLHREPPAQKGLLPTV